MKRHIPSSTLAALLALGHGIAPAQTVGGAVLDCATGEPIDSVRVVIVQHASNFRDSTLSDAAGQWRYVLSTGLPSAQGAPPADFAVSPFYPNPFFPTTSLILHLARPGTVSVVVYDMRGRLVEEHAFQLPAGRSSLLWEGGGSAGVYVARITSGEQVVRRKMIQLRPGRGRSRMLLCPTAPPPAAPASKAPGGDLMLIFSKFAYVPDTLVVQAEAGTWLVTHLQTIHTHAVVAELHNDILYKMAEEGPYHLGDLHTYNHTDIPRLMQGGVDVQVFAIWIDPDRYRSQPFSRAMEYVALWQQELTANQDHIAQVAGWRELHQTLEEGRIGGILAVEGGHAIENSLSKLRALYAAGVRCLTITWNNSTDWAVSASDSRSTFVGLSPFGREVIALMDSLGMIVDVSHTGEQTIRDIVALTRNPIIASHSGARALRDHVRNLRDEQIIALAATGGVVGVVFYPTFLVPANQRADVNSVADHIDYIARLVGVDHVGIGSDFDGIGRTPQGLEDCSRLPNLTWTLLRRGHTMQEVEKILGGNFLRVFRAVCGEGQLCRTGAGAQLR
ncbi:MAG: membrane dipeptidase [Candidatus Oleimicrobiaceae bacterium]